ncbi:MAG TPA: hypothetical protein VEY71_09035 [Chitinophagales bacterium]|nr:hypothetical protein [Chitinophagales bacterium]
MTGNSKSEARIGDAGTQQHTAESAPLIDNFLPDFDFFETHSITVNTSTRDGYTRMLQTDLNGSRLIRLLFRLRGMPKSFNTIENLHSLGFVKLAERHGSEIVFGMVTDSPFFQSCRTGITAQDFVNAIGPDVIRAAINFRIINTGSADVMVTTETRVQCGSNKMRDKFKFYWFVVKPFSKFIRRLMLRQIKKHIEAG